MRTFTFLKHHKVSLLIAVVLLFIQANCELTLPTLMSDIVDVGITRAGIASVVPDRIKDDSLKDVELFLSQGELRRVEGLYGAADVRGVRSFTGGDAERSDIESLLGEAEMLAYQFGQGIPTEQFAKSAARAAAGASGAGSETAERSLAARLEASFGDKITNAVLGKLVQTGAISKDQLVEGRDDLVKSLGDNADTVVNLRAVEFVKSAYKAVGMDLGRVQADYLAREAAIMLGFTLVGAACAIGAVFNASRTAALVARDLRHDLYERVLSFSPQEMSEFSVASLTTRGTNDIQQIQTVLVMCLRIVLFAPCMGIGAVWRVVAYGNTGMQWIVVVAVCVIAAVVGVLMGLTLPRFRKMQTYVDKNNLVAREIITGIMPVRAFGRTAYEEQRYDHVNAQLTSTYIFTNRAMSFMLPLMLLIMNVTSVAIIWFGGHGIDAGTLQLGALMAYMNYTMQVIMSFMILTMISVMLPRADVAAARVIEVLKTRSSISDPETNGQSVDTPADGGDDWLGDLVFDNVSFAYPGAPDPTIAGVSFEVKPGRTLGIIGSTGAGKSTLVQLIPRLYDVTDGSVRIDGRDVRDIGLRRLRSLIGFVPQQAVLFSGDIEDNIKYGEPAMSDESMERAAQIAQACDFIEAKRGGFLSAISQGGANVSGGQRQRLAIARALATRPRILVFDDAFSALDYKTDTNLRDALAEQVSGTTVVIVAQRIATIMRADQIVVLDEGRVVGEGTHDELLRSSQEYLEIATSQLSAKELGLDDGRVGDASARGDER